MKLLFLILFILSIFFGPKNIFAKEENINCPNRYLTLVNPVRGRNLWVDQSLKPLRDQYNTIKDKNFSATWLLQYDILKDKEVVNEIIRFNDKQELGVLLEVSNQFALNARVVYPMNTPWFRPQAIFLSGYSQSERKKLVDELLKQFKNLFGYYPKSVGAWWIDSYSLNYLKERYNVESVLIVADQKTTDNYGVWGQWWGVPFYPSKSNILIPANNLNNKLDVVVVQWAQRDPLRAYGEGPNISNYSLQANDYIRQGLKTNYFKEISNIYLDCSNKIGQITVGLETGIESVGFFDEYANQLQYLSTLEKLQSVTMEEFADNFKDIFPGYPTDFKIDYINSQWLLIPEKRLNIKLNDEIIYNSNVAFKDFFLADNSDFLDRRLNKENYQRDQIYLPWWVCFLIPVIGWFLIKKRFIFGFCTLLFILFTYGLILRSYYQYGWIIYFGPVIDNLHLLQIGSVVIGLCLIYIYTQLYKNKWYLIALPLTFAFDAILSSLRFSVISGRYLFGFLLDSFRFVGISFSNPIKFYLVNQDLPGYQAAALLKFDFSKIWNSPWLSIFVYPVIHLILAIIVGFLILKLSYKLRIIAILIMASISILFLIQIFQSDPRVVVPIY